MRGLKARSRKDAEDAYRKLWKVPNSLVQPLILEVTNTEKSNLTELSILVTDTRSFLRRDESSGEFLYFIPGMGDCAYSDISVKDVRNGIKVVIKKFDRFSLGVVVRAGLVNRFRSPNHPPGHDKMGLVEWWQLFHGRVRGQL